MREIKFRAWHKAEKKMYGNPENTRWVEMLRVSGETGFDECDVDLTTEEGEGQSVSFDEVELMQYTGLKDKNGREVYEGDLIKNEHGRICEVVWHEYMGCWDAKVRKFGAESKGGHLGFQNNEWSRHVIIIGNIYENPELLKATP